METTTGASGVTGAAALEALFDTTPQPVRKRPFPHVVMDDFFRPEVFRELKASFPQIEQLPASRTSARSLFWGDPAYERHLDAHPIWRRLFDAVQSQAFLDHIVRQFGQVMVAPEFLVESGQLRFVSYCESRKEKESSDFRQPDHRPEDICARLDIFHGWPGYSRPAHLDHRRRLLSMLVYFDSPEEIEMVGGRLNLHDPSPDLLLAARLGATRCPPAWLALRQAWSPPAVIEPKANRTAFFAASQRAWHSVPPIQSLRSPRAFLHIVLSSSHEIWR